jgi:FkbM family methyltransferase
MTDKKLRFSDAESRLLKQLKAYGYSPDVIYDIGASNGMWSYNINRIFPQAQYELFEPLSETLAAYRETIEKQLATYPNFRLHKIGLGDTNDAQEMAVFTGGFGSTFLDIGRIKKRAGSSKGEKWLDGIASFRVHRLDDFVAEQKLPTPKIVKMDTQGYELAIVNGGRETVKKADILILETWLYRGYGAATPLLHELMAAVGELGFVLTDFGDIYWGTGHRLTSIDAIFMRSAFLDSMASKTDGLRWRIWD